MKRTAQNLVEFVFIFPLLIIILFGILEFGIYFRNANVVEDIAKEASSSASRKLVLDTMTSSTITDTSSTGFNKAVKAAIDVVNKRRKQLGLITLGFAYTNLGGTRPYAVYQINSTQTRMIGGVATPLVTLIVDYSAPTEKGVIVQLVYQYRTLLLGAAFPVLGGAPIVIIPRDMPISSSKIRQYVTY